MFNSVYWFVKERGGLVKLKCFCENKECELEFKTEFNVAPDSVILDNPILCIHCGEPVRAEKDYDGVTIVIYNDEMGFYDGLTKGKAYIVTEETETQYVIGRNDLGGTSRISKDKFIIV